MNLYISASTFKYVVIGSGFSGKSSIIVRYSDDVFQESYMNTVGVDYVILFQITCNRSSRPK